MKYLFLFFSLFFIKLSFAQDFEISNSINQVLFIDRENPIHIVSENCKNSELQVKISDGFIKGENGNYIVRVSNYGFTNISVYKKDKLIKTLRYLVRELPSPELSFLGRTGGNISKDELLKAKEIGVFIPLFPDLLNYKVIEFTTFISSPSGRFHEDITSFNDTISRQQRELLKSVSIGYRLSIYGKVQNVVNGRIFRTNYLDFKIVK